MKKDTVTINGVAYDAHTGMRVASEIKPTAPKKNAPKTTVAAQSVHAKTQKTKTLSRRHAKGGKRTTLLEAPAATAKKSPHISKFAPTTPKKTRVINDMAPATHRAQVVHRQKVVQKQAKPTPPPAHVLKSKAITEAVAKSHKKPAPKQQSYAARHSRAFIISVVVAVLIVIAGYVTYVNLPSLSVRIAAAQSGVNADYPSYLPASYSLNGPVQFTNGEVTLDFNANAGPQNFKITQSKSNWDSSALLENYIKPKYGEEYATYTDSGLTIYVHDTNAAWVNGGILHTIIGDAPLSADQMRRIAMSM